MNFADLMSAQIAKAKKDQPGIQRTSENDASASTPIYQSRRELEEVREAAYHAEQAALEAKRAAKQSAKRKREEEEQLHAAQIEEKKRILTQESRRRREAEEREEELRRRKRLGLPPPSSKNSEDNGEADNDNAELEPGEVMKGLRELNEPITLFGESEQARQKRYNRLLAERGASIENGGIVVLSKGPIPTTLKLLPESDIKVPKSLPPPGKSRYHLFCQLASYFTMILQEWESAMANRDAAAKQTFQGKAAERAMLQSKENLKPLFKHFERGDLEEGILEPIVDIVRAAQERRYVDANDGYLQLSIGKAAWPIGVTMVGIHERSAREKLHESGKGEAHIMSDEITRKYLQSIKRCLSFAQTKWPPDDQLQLMG